MTQRPTLWQNLMNGTGQALPVALLGGLVAFGTLMVNVQIQLSELRLKQDQTLQILERSEEAREKALAWLKEEIKDIERRVDRLEGRRP
ncbi:MAG: hypothetical protein CL844_05015 [Crocinitomicaceae bacterium]|nr:hypothetical protein [Crocinitomicaceae bacterium]|tara:strand:- start:3182 stop:3448 length:267 start_codon:yes stop_codon:yes gene_type:complete